MPEISIIIPTQNEDACIGQTLDHLRKVGGSEVVVVDGESTDQTVDIALSVGVHVISAKPSRGHQMNIGARESKGEILLFLHADTQLPQGFVREVLKILNKSSVASGAFQLAIDSSRRSLRFVERLVNLRSRLLQMPYGDQAIFLRRETFNRVGGFPELSVMEDFELVRRLRRIGRIEISPLCVKTSPRRWLAHGIWRTTLLNQLCIAGYVLSVSPDTIAAWRRHTTKMTPSQSQPTLTRLKSNDLIKAQQ